MTMNQSEARFSHFPRLLHKLLQHSAPHYVGGVISVQIDFYGRTGPALYCVRASSSDRAACQLLFDGLLCWAFS